MLFFFLPDVRDLIVLKLGSGGETNGVRKLKSEASDGAATEVDPLVGEPPMLF